MEKLAFALVVGSAPSLLTGADWGAIIWALAWAALISYASLSRERVAQERAGTDKTESRAILPEIILGGGLGLAASLLVPELFPRLKTFSGVTVLAMLGGFMGRAGWQLAVRLLEAKYGGPPGGKGGTSAP